MNAKAVFLMLLGGLLLAGLFIRLRPAVALPSLPVPLAQQSSATAKIFDLQHQSKRPLDGVPTLVVQQGETVELRLSSDSTGELHMHGYDLHAEVREGEIAKLSFVAEHSGRFQIELHDSHHGHVDLAVLEVLPR